MLNLIRKFIQHTVLGNTVYSSDAKPYMTNKNKPLWENFDSLIEQAVVHQKASLYSDLNEDMKWALTVAALRENKTEILDAEYDHFNQLVADVLVTRGSFGSLRRLYAELVATLIESNSSKDAHIAYCINTALEKEEDKQAYIAVNEQEKKGNFYVEDYSF